MAVELDRGGTVRSSKPVGGMNNAPSGFDSHTLPIRERGLRSIRKPFSFWLLVAEHRVESLLGFVAEVVTLAQADATVPAQDGVVVARRTVGFGLLVEPHGPADPFVGD